MESSGIDVNGNGVLDDAEIADRDVSCLAPGEVSRRIPRAPSERCPAGGTEVQKGPDRNGNGQLDDDEVESRELVCNPLRLARTVPEPEGEHCVAGGLALQTGPDLDGDGELDDGEVDETTYQCSTVMEHGVTVQTVAEVAALSEITEIRGYLVIGTRGGSSPIEASFPQLRKIAGGLVMGDSPQLHSVLLPELTEVGSLWIGDFYDHEVQSISLPKLVSIHGRLQVSNSSLLTSLALPALERIAGDVEILLNPALRTLSLPELHRLGGKVQVRNNDELAALTLSSDAPMLEVEVAFNPKLAQLSLTTPEAPTVRVSNNARLTDLAISDPGDGLRSGKLGPVAIRSNQSLMRPTFTAERIASILIDGSPLLMTRIIADQIDTTLTIFDAAGTVSLQRRNVSDSPFLIGGEVLLRGPMTALTVPGQRLRVDADFRLESTALTELRHLEHVGKDVLLSNNPQLSVVDPISFVAGGVQVYKSAISNFNFIPQSEIFGTLGLTNNEDLEKLLSLEHMQRIHGGMVISGNYKLERIISPMSQLGGGLILQQNFALKELRLDNLPQIGTLSIQESLLSEISFPALQTISRITLWRNVEVQRLHLPALQSLSSIYAESNSSLPRCHLLDLCARFSLIGAQCDLRANGPCP